MNTETCGAVLRGVEKHYPGFDLGPVDLAVPAGSIVGLVGENGAGKTTLLKLLTGVNPADAGEITLEGGSPADAASRCELGVVFEDAYFSESLTAKQIGKSLAGIFGRRWDGKEYQRLLAQFGLDSAKPVKTYSRGMRMKLSLATALAHHPRMLVLDEATSGLDPVVRGAILDLLLDFIQDETRSILISSHITSDLEQVADSIAYLHKGRLLFQEDVRSKGSGNAGTTNILRTYGKKAAALTLAGDMGKGVAAVLIGRLLFGLFLPVPDATVYGAHLAAIAATCGHLWPVWFGFKGGKGVAVAAGAILASQPVVVAGLVVVFFTLAFATRIVSLASITVAVLYPVFTALWCWYRGGVIWFPTLCAAIMGVLVIWMHRAP